jgi:hypothetical protein
MITGPAVLALRRGTVAIDASGMRRRARRLLHGTCAAVVALTLAAGCERAPGPADDRGAPPGGMTEDEFVGQVAALTVAVEEGLTGEAARDRAADLGGGRHTRDEIDAYANLLRADPERWADVRERIDRRIEELRGRESVPSATPRAEDEPQGEGPAGARTDAPHNESADAS